MEKFSIAETVYKNAILVHLQEKKIEKEEIITMFSIVKCFLFAA